MKFLQLNSVLSIAIIAWFVAQVLKTLLHWARTKKFSAERLTGAGGMPSCHSAAVCSLAIAVSRVSGADSPEFALSFVFAMVVMYDAMGVRRAAGLHAKELNRLKKIIDEYDAEDLDDISNILEKGEFDSAENQKLKEYLGHTPFEVLGGALLGILIAMAFPIQI